MTVQQEILVMTALYLNHGTKLLYPFISVIIIIYIILGTKHAYINSLEGTAKQDALVQLRTGISRRVIAADQNYYLDTPDFMTCFEELRVDFFHSSKLLSLTEKNESKGKVGNITSEILIRRDEETDLE